MSRRPHCTARAAGTGRTCRSFGCWRTPGPSDLYCKRHAQEVAAFSDDHRIVNIKTGRIEMVPANRLNCRPRTGPPPATVDDICAELRTVRCARDWQRCQQAIFADLPAVLTQRRDSLGTVYAAGVNPDLADALRVARRRLEQIGATP
jgi:hypothetical protein